MRDMNVDDEREAVAEVVVEGAEGERERERERKKEPIFFFSRLFFFFRAFFLSPFLRTQASAPAGDKPSSKSATVTDGGFVAAPGAPGSDAVDAA